MKEIHVAGPLIAGLQCCGRCGEVLSDYRNAMVPEGDPMPLGWKVGSHIAIERGFPTSYWVTSEDPTCSEALLLS